MSDVDEDEHDPHTDQLIGRHDDDLGAVELRGWQPGPAGVATLDFNDGEITVLTDVADPSLVSTVFIGDDAPGRAAMIEALIGPDHPEGQAFIDALGPTPEVVRPGRVDRARPGTDLGGRRRSPSEVYLRITRLAVLTNELETVGFAPGVNAVGLIEAALIGFGLPDDLRPMPDPTAVLLQGVDGVEALLAGGDGWEILQDHGDSIAGLLAAVIPHLDGTPLLARRIDDLTARVRSASEPETDDSAAAAAAAPMSRVAPMRVDVGFPMLVAPDDDATLLTPISPDDGSLGERDRFSLDVALIDLDGVAVVRAELRRPEVCVTLRDDRPDSADRSGVDGPGWWLRVFCIDDWHGTMPGLPLPIAMAPFTEDQLGTFSAAALLPDHLYEPDVLIDVTADPLASWQPKSKRALRHAVRLGQLAARQERVGDPNAEPNWRRCSEAWEQVGDERRAHLASDRVRRLSMPGRRFRRESVPLAFPPFLFDEITNASR